MRICSNAVIKAILSEIFVELVKKYLQNLQEKEERPRGVEEINQLLVENGDFPASWVGVEKPTYRKNPPPVARDFLINLKCYERYYFAFVR